MIRFVIRRAPPETRALGHQFDFISLGRPDIDCKARCFERDGRFFIIETLHPVPGKRPQKIDVGPGAIPVMRYRILASEVRLEGFE